MALAFVHQARALLVRELRSRGLVARYTTTWALFRDDYQHLSDEQQIKLQNETKHLVAELFQLGATDWNIRIPLFNKTVTKTHPYPVLLDLERAKAHLLTLQDDDTKAALLKLVDAVSRENAEDDD